MNALGQVQAADLVECEACEGSGFDQDESCYFSDGPADYPYHAVDCEVCDGLGKVAPEDDDFALVPPAARISPTEMMW